MSIKNINQIWQMKTRTENSGTGGYKPSLNKNKLQVTSKNIENIVYKQPEREWTYKDFVGIVRRELERYQGK